MSRIYTTAMGKSIDMASLRAKNETVRAVGNMSVNSRGDMIDGNDQVIQDSNKRANMRYNRISTNLGAQPRGAQTAKSDVKTPAATENVKAELSSVEQQEFDEFNEPDPVKTVSEEKKENVTNSTSRRTKKQ